MCKINYKFRMDFSAGISNVYPIHEDLILSSSRTGNNKYLTSSIGVKFSFVGDDFDAIMGEDIEWEFTLRIDKIAEDGVVTENWRLGTFTKLDAEVFDEKFESRIDVSIEVFDLYKKLQDKENVELDFFGLNVGTKTVMYDIQPIFQIYDTVSGKISNHVRWSYSEEIPQFPTQSSTKLQTDYHFTKIPLSFFAYGMGFGEDDINGKWDLGPLSQTYVHQNGLYRIEFNLTFGYLAASIVRISDSVVVYDSNIEWTGFSDQLIHVNGEDVGVYNIHLADFYMRTLIGVDAVAGETVVAIPSNDISEERNVYTHILKGSFLNIDVSTEVQETENKYPVSNIATGVDGNRYIVELTSPPFRTPVLKSSWLAGGVFMDFSVEALGFFTSAAKRIKNNYCYELVDVMREMIGNLVEEVSVGDSLGEFFGVATNNPLTGSAWKRIFITHKSNLKTVDFETPASKQSIRYSDIKTLLEFAFNCFPYLNSNELRFEHTLFFENGKNYTTETVGVDLTTNFEAKTDKAWVYDTAKWKYAKEEIPSGIKIKWSEEVGSLFEGQELKLLSKYADNGDALSKNIPIFMSDLDFVMSNPNNVSSDGFVLMFVEEDVNGDLIVDYEDVDGQLNIQNGKGSIIYLMDKFWRHNLPCKKVEINGVEVDATSVKKTRIQEIIFADGGDVDNLQLVKTTLGNGEIEKWDINLDDGSINATLRHNID